MLQLRSYFLVLCLNILYCRVWAFPDCSGDGGKHFGCHRAAEPPPPVFEEVDAEYIWKNHVLPRRPALLKGAALDWPARELWTDSFLMGRYGNLTVKLEEKREKTGDDSKLGGEKRPLGREWLGRYVNVSTGVSSSSYVVSQLPSPMYGDVRIPAPFSEVGFRSRLLEANLWISDGGTRSMLHRDADNVVNCVVRGSKEWILVHPAFAAVLPMAAERVGEVGGFAKLDPENIEDLDSIRDVQWQHVTVYAGDCLYLPWGYLHQVTSPPGRNIAVSLLFSIMKHFEPEHQNKSVEVTSSSSIPTSLKKPTLEQNRPVWDYDGYGDMSMGNVDPENVRQRLMAWTVDRDELASVPLKDLLLYSKGGRKADQSWIAFEPVLEAIKDTKNVLTKSSRFSAQDAKRVWEEWTNVGFAKNVTEDEAFMTKQDFVKRYVRELHGRANDEADGHLEHDSFVSTLAFRKQTISEASTWFEGIGDVNSDGKISVGELKELPAGAFLHHLHLLFHFDPGNTDEWEYFVVESKDVQMSFTQSLKKHNQTHLLFIPSTFLSSYTSQAGGSKATAKSIIQQIIHSLPTPKQPIYIPTSSIKSVLQTILVPFNTRKAHQDPALLDLENQL